MSELVYLALGPAPVDYLDGWDMQRRVHARRVADEIPDSCLLLEHEPVYTAGKRTAASDRPFGDPGAAVIDVDRGGKITWHGPGQLIGYPIIKLREPVDVVAYVRALEEAMIRTCAEFGVTAVRVAGRSGAWVPGTPDRKVGAIGARVARGVTMHGLALNCDCDLSWYDRIVPCGIRDAGVTTLSAETGRTITVAEVQPVLERHLAEALGYRTWRYADDPGSAITDGLYKGAALGFALRRAGGEVPVITGPEEGAAGCGRLRASHADREQVIDTLKTAFADGRLDKDDLDARVGQTLAARTYAELAMATAGIPAAPAPAPASASAPPRRAARPPVNKEAVKWGLVAAGAMIPPAMFIAAVYGAPVTLALLALPLLVIELPVVLIFVVLTLARQRNDRSRASRGHLPPRSGQAGRAVEAERHGSTGPDPAPPGACADQASADLRVRGSRRDRTRRRGQGAPVPRGARPAPGAGWAAATTSP